MMTRKTLMGLAVAAALALSVGGVTAGEAAAGGGQGLSRLGDGPLGRFIQGRIGKLLVLRSKLGITAEQRGRIADVLKAHRAEIAKAVQGVVEKRRALRDAVLADQPDEKAIRAAADGLSKAIGDAAVLASRVRGEVQPILTPEQRETLKAFRAEHDEDLDAFLRKMAETK